MNYHKNWNTVINAVYVAELALRDFEPVKDLIKILQGINQEDLARIISRHHTEHLSTGQYSAEAVVHDALWGIVQAHADFVGR